MKNQKVAHQFFLIFQFRRDFGGGGTSSFKQRLEKAEIVFFLTTFTPPPNLVQIEK